MAARWLAIAQAQRTIRTAQKVKRIACIVPRSIKSVSHVPCPARKRAGEGAWGEGRGAVAFACCTLCCESTCD